MSEKNSPSSPVDERTDYSPDGRRVLTKQMFITMMTMIATVMILMLGLESDQDES